jgi:hypothetical protein
MLWYKMPYNTRPTQTGLDLKSKSSHAGFVLLDDGLAFLSGIVGLRKEHAVVAGGLFGFAHAAGLVGRSVLCRGSIDAWAGTLRTYLGFLALGGLSWCLRLRGDGGFYLIERCVSELHDQGYDLVFLHEQGLAMDDCAGKHWIGLPSEPKNPKSDMATIGW